MKIACYSWKAGLMTIVCSRAKEMGVEITKLPYISDLKDIGFQNYVLVNPERTFGEWDVIKKYAKGNSDSEIVVNAIGCFDGREDELSKKMGSLENIKVLGLEAAIEESHRILDECNN